ncbi:MAG: hypothetical protein ACK4YV_08020 [Emticicia sp.]
MLAVLALFGILFLYFFTGIFSFHRRSLDWNGENSFLKTPRTYRASFFSLIDILFSFLILMAIVIFLTSFSIKYNSLAQFLVVFVALATMLVPFLHFRIKYQYWQQNRLKDYVFDPILKKITIIGESTESFNFDDIQVLEYYVATNYQLTEGYIKLIFKDARPPIFLTPLLPCYPILLDFFVGVEKQLINQRIFGIG